MNNREIDALVAEYVMCFEYRVDETGRSFFWCPKTNVGMATIDIFNSKHFLPHYSTDIAAAWEVFTAIGSGSCGEISIAQVDSPHSHHWECSFWYDGMDERISVKSDTAPMAICLAALKAKGVEVDGL